MQKKIKRLSIKKQRVKVYYKICRTCPYFNEQHLQPKEKTKRICPPVSIEDNSSNILLVFEAPGEQEYMVGKAIQPTIKQGGSAGQRILKSWNICGKQRSDFDIAEAVMCYPGKNSKQKFKRPSKVAERVCSKILENKINNKKYIKIITFGVSAARVIQNMNLKYTTRIISVKHPNGGISKVKLNSLW